MSEWTEISDADIDIDYKAKEVNIAVGVDDWGMSYVTLTFDQIRDINLEISE